MADPLRAPKGVAEYVPPQSEVFRQVRDALIAPALTAGYSYLELPIFEDTALFERGVGPDTDIVGKEMYTFDDRGGRSLSLRPEGTAGVVRAVIEHGLDRGGLPVKVWYAGPFFRAERPQRGRYRQFNQVGVEAIGYDDPALDAEVIAMADAGFKSLGLTGYRLLLNSLGDAAERPAYRDQLRDFVRGLNLDPATLSRVESNPLRILDDKRREVQSLLADAPVLRDFISEEAKAHHQAVCRYLADLGIEFEEDPKLVRGLDYYTRTTFEFVHDGLGSQSAIGGGGRYDGLVADLGGDDLSGVGFGVGVDRTMLACAAEGVGPTAAPQADVFLIPMGAASKRKLVTAAAELRAAGVRTDLAYGDRGVKASMRAADRAGASVAVIMGEREVAANCAVIKNLADGTQETVSAGEMGAAVAAALAATVSHGFTSSSSGASSRAADTDGALASTETPKQSRRVEQ